MTTELLRRVRWANVARAAAILLALALVLAWPRLRPGADPLPPAAAAPALPDRVGTTEVAEPAAAASDAGRPSRRRATAARRARPRAASHRRRHVTPPPRRHPRGARPATVAAPARALAPAAVPAPAAAPAPAPPGAEFRP